jgi:hypothetical protein
LEAIKIVPKSLKIVSFGWNQMSKGIYVASQDTWDRLPPLSVGNIFQTSFFYPLRPPGPVEK